MVLVTQVLVHSDEGVQFPSLRTPEFQGDIRKTGSLRDLKLKG
jgi:hypothetical protein